MNLQFSDDNPKDFVLNLVSCKFHNYHYSSVHENALLDFTINYSEGGKVPDI